jgi:hypothetical protein
MSYWKVTEADRDASGRIWVTAPPERRLSDLLPAPAEAPTTPSARPWRPGRLELAGIAGGLLLALALIVLIVQLTPVREVQHAASTVAVVPTVRAAVPTSAPTVRPVASAVMVVAWAAPDGQVLGPIPQPLTATARFDDDWLGVPWQGGTVWVRRADWPNPPLAKLPNLAPPTPIPAPLVVYVAATAPPPTRIVYEKPSDKEGPHEGANKITPAQQPIVAPTSAPTPLGCWQGPPTVLRPGQQPCWRGVPYVLPDQP